jgi:hypothetical protein
MDLGRKGDASDIVMFAIIMFFLAVSFIIVIFVNSKLTDVITDTQLSNSSAAPSIISSFNNVNDNVVQRGYVIIFALMLIFMMVSAMMVRVHPIFFFIYIITLAVTILLTVYTSNLYYSLINTEQLADIAANQTMITFFMKNSVIITIAVAALSMIVLFGKFFSAPFGGTQDV